MACPYSDSRNRLFLDGVLAVFNGNQQRMDIGYLASPCAMGQSSLYAHRDLGSVCSGHQHTGQQARNSQEKEKSADIGHSRKND